MCNKDFDCGCNAHHPCGCGDSACGNCARGGCGCCDGNSFTVIRYVYGATGPTGATEQVT